MKIDDKIKIFMREKETFQALTILSFDTIIYGVRYIVIGIFLLTVFDIGSFKMLL